MKAPKLADRIAKITPEVTKVKAYPMKVTRRPVLPVAIVAASFLICWLTPMSGAQERGQGVRHTTIAHWLTARSDVRIWLKQTKARPKA